MQPEYCEYWIHIGPEYTRGARSLHTNIFNKHQILVSNDSRWIQFQNRGKAAAAFFFPQNNRLNCTEFSNEHRPHFLWHDPPEKIPLDLAEKMSPPSILIYIMIIISASQGGPSTLFSLLESVNGSAGPSECWKATCRDPDCSHNDLLLLLLLQLPSRQLVWFHTCCRIATAQWLTMYTPGAQQSAHAGTSSNVPPSRGARW